MVWRVVCRAGMILFAIACYATESMVAQAGQPPGWPVSDNAGILTPVWAIAIERDTLAIASFTLLSEVALWLRPLPPHTLNLSLCLRLSVAQTVIPVSVCFAPSPVMNAAPAVPLSVTMCSPFCRPSAGGGGVPCVIKKPLRPSQRVMTPGDTFSIEAYHKLNRASAVSQFVGGDLIHRELSGLHQLYIPHIFSYLNEDIDFVLSPA